MKLLVIADDFTGAMDTGVQFSKNAINTLVSTRIDLDFDTIQQDIEVLVVDTESRHISPDKAYEKVYDITRRAREYGIQYVYKKTDSTLRGNIGAELKAIIDAWKSMPVMYVPAFPKMGRTTVNGRQLVDGVPLHETFYANDLLNPIKTSYIPEIISKQADVKTVVIVNGGELTVDLKEQNMVYIFDARVEEDLANIGSILKSANKLSIIAGCAGFAEQLSDLIDFEKNSGLELIKSQNILVICGTINEKSIQQVKFGEKYNFESILLVSEQKRSKEYWETSEGKKLIKEILRKITASGKIIIKTINQKNEVDLAVNSLQIAENLGNLTQKILSSGIPCTLVVFGGDTAIRVMEAIECVALKPLEEIVPGVAVSKMAGKYGEMTLITKAGGFGEKDILLKIQKYLERKI